MIFIFPARWGADCFEFININIQYIKYIPMQFGTYYCWLILYLNKEENLEPQLDSTIYNSLQSKSSILSMIQLLHSVTCLYSK